MPVRVQVLAVSAIAIAAIALIGVNTAGRFLTRTQAPESSAAAPKPTAPGVFKPTEAQMRTLRVATVTTTDFRGERLAEGRIALDGDRSTPVYSPYSGRVTRLIANLGDEVRRGDPLLAIEASEFAQAQNDLIGASSALATARAQLSMAETSEQRKHALYDARAGSLQDWQQSKTDLAVAQNAARAAQVSLDLVRGRLRILGKSGADIEALESARRVDPASFIVAPISGTVTDRQVGSGQFVQSGQTTPLYTIGDLSTVWLIANVREADSSLVHKGDPVEVHVLALPGRVFKAKVAHVAPSVDPATHRLAVRAVVDNPDRALKPEMFATFSIITAAATAAPAVPADAVIYEGDAARVWVVQADGSLVLRQIEPGRAVSGQIEVVRGLKAGEKIVSGGALFIDRAAKAD